MMTNKRLLSSIFAALTIGVPFCIFKYLMGVLAVRESDKLSIEGLRYLGYAIIAWSLIDLVMNFAKCIIDAIKQKYTMEHCFLGQIGFFFNRQTLFLCIDTMLSFSIICFVLWSGWITELTRHESYLWYLATTINLMSLSFVTIWTEYKLNSDNTVM